MAANHLAHAVGPLERVANLRQFAFPVVADRKAAAQLNEWQTFTVWSKTGMNTPGICSGAIGETGDRPKRGC